jgi:hypothetical protein
MAKPLNKQQPSSSVANMLDPNVGAAAIKPPENIDTQVLTPIVRQFPDATPPPIPVTGEPANVLRQFTLTASTEDILKSIVDIYSKASGLNLRHSEVLRAILVALQHAIPELTREAAHIGRLKRAKQERGNEGLRDALERKIARAIVAGMRAANTMNEG